MMALMADASSQIDEAASAYSKFFWLYVGLLLLTALCTVLMYRAGAKLQEAVKADADARIGEAKGVAETAKTDAAKANENAQAAKLETAKDSERAANLEKQAAVARLELEQLKEATKPWLLSDDKRQALVDKFREIGPNKVMITPMVTSASAFEFATQLRSIFKEAGWRVSGESSVALPGDDEDLFGLKYVVKSDSDKPAYLNPLYNTMLNAGVPVMGAWDDHFLPGDFQIIVGRKPREGETKMANGEHDAAVK
jgi:hypothetical protein